MVGGTPLEGGSGKRIQGCGVQGHRHRNARSVGSPGHRLKKLHQHCGLTMELGSLVSVKGSGEIAMVVSLASTAATEFVSGAGGGGASATEILVCELLLVEAMACAWLPITFETPGTAVSPISSGGNGTVFERADSKRSGPGPIMGRYPAPSVPAIARPKPRNRSGSRLCGDGDFGSQSRHRLLKAGNKYPILRFLIIVAFLSDGI